MKPIVISVAAIVLGCIAVTPAMAGDPATKAPSSARAAKKNAPPKRSKEEIINEAKDLMVKANSDLYIAKLTWKNHVLTKRLGKGDDYDLTNYNSFPATLQNIRSKLKALATTEEQKKAILEWSIAIQARYNAIEDYQNSSRISELDDASAAAYERVLYSFE